MTEEGSQRLKLIPKVFQRYSKLYQVRMTCAFCSKTFALNETIVRRKVAIYENNIRRQRVRLYCLEHIDQAQDDELQTRARGHPYRNCEHCAQLQNLSTFPTYSWIEWVWNGMRQVEIKMTQTKQEDSWRCGYHNLWHCPKHARTCVIKHGPRYVKCFSYKAREALEGKDWQALAKCFSDDIFIREICKLSTWDEQITLKMFICAECGKIACECKGYEELFWKEKEQKALL